MNKKLYVFPVAAIMSLGIAGCGMNDEAAVQDRYNDSMQPVGYYSNENHDNRGGNAQILDGADNDGPVTEMMDHTMGEEGQAYRNNGNNTFSRNDENYHGHLGYNVRQAKSSYYEAYDGKLVEKINKAAHVSNVKDVQSVVKGNDVLIAVLLVDNDREKETIANIRQAVQPYLNGKKSTIVTNPSTYNRIKVIDNDLRDGGPRDQINLDIDNLFSTNANK
ncbi:YhcN/YlaJ family sporulation lipoprotein [Bacillus sp. FJAT-49705]|uniref:YhcN/YlaJ family sporulation lipoprotein n=1 Tax=Cytobacillus citreus TaxID=2833586 RepID=A0ABS5NUD4_9BACI|nr:YhcN/YlaJ family sporulation lipoprotein [Cytobacillus citreus]MBS4191445.1 YhcN/YlaJ family sporulation lipoprotein [Cytobacillus citreus]